MHHLHDEWYLFDVVVNIWLNICDALSTSFLNGHQTHWADKNTTQCIIKAFKLSNSAHIKGDKRNGTTLHWSGYH